MELVALSPGLRVNSPVHGEDVQATEAAPQKC